MEGAGGGGGGLGVVGDHDDGLAVIGGEGAEEVEDGAGGFAVEVITGPSTELVRVDVGEILDGQAEISGDIAVGDEVVVAT